MLWGIGTGRCGTRSLAKQLGGLHEPYPLLDRLPNKYERGFISSVELSELRERIADRAKIDTLCIVDFQQASCIDLILEQDEHARFACVYRKPHDCIASLISGGACRKESYSSSSKDYSSESEHCLRISQPTENFESCKDLITAIYHYNNTNEKIYQLKLNMPERVRLFRTEDLKEHKNKYPKKYSWHEDLYDYVKILCTPIYERLSDVTI